MFRVLFVSSEVYPIIKSGGLADVAGALPKALADRGHDVRILMPAYAEALQRLSYVEPVANLFISSVGRHVQLLESRIPGTSNRVWLVHDPPLFSRPGIYTNAYGSDWPDNLDRFALLCASAARITNGTAGISWQPDCVHGNDWPCGLIPAYLDPGRRPRTVFTIHNLAHQGLFQSYQLDRLGISDHAQHNGNLLHHGKLSFLKSAINLYDQLTTVSPTYAAEISNGPLDGTIGDGMRQRRDPCKGVLNGADYTLWDPGRDPFIAHRYNATLLSRKAANKQVLQLQCGFKPCASTPLLGIVSRLVYQKGIDLVLDALPALVARGVQLVVLGIGEVHLEHRLSAFSARNPRHVAFFRRFDERLAHQVQAGADILLMPSRFEPCGLNQMYAQRYGTVPVVRRTGGLADTVHDFRVNVDRSLSTGFIFDDASAWALEETLYRCLSTFKQPAIWRTIQLRGMGRDFGWERSAQHYESIYAQTTRGV